MRRRQFIALLGGVAVWPLAARAQQSSNKIPQIGVLWHAGNEEEEAIYLSALRRGFSDQGYVEGQNLTLVNTFAGEAYERFNGNAEVLVRRRVDVIVAVTRLAAVAAQRATSTIPIVFAVHADPVGVGHVASLSRPGGNITGMSMLMTELSVKELELLKEAIPHATRVGVLWNPTTPSHLPARQAVEAAGKKLGVQLIMVAARIVEDFAGAFSEMSRERVDGFLVIASPVTTVGREPLAQLALEHRLPSIFSFKSSVQAGGLMSYGADALDLWRRAGIYIGKILRGASPADLPVEQASKYELVNKPQDGQGARPHHPDDAAQPRRRGHRIAPALRSECCGARVCCWHKCQFAAMQRDGPVPGVLLTWQARFSTPARSVGLACCPDRAQA